MPCWRGAWHPGSAHLFDAHTHTHTRAVLPPSWEHKRPLTFNVTDVRPGAEIFLNMRDSSSDESESEDEPEPEPTARALRQSKRRASEGVESRGEVGLGLCWIVFGIWGGGATANCLVRCILGFPLNGCRQTCCLFGWQGHIIGATVLHWLAGCHGDLVHMTSGWRLRRGPGRESRPQEACCAQRSDDPPEGKEGQGSRGHAPPRTGRQGTHPRQLQVWHVSAMVMPGSAVSILEL
jgi:hypothetical protein